MLPLEGLSTLGSAPGPFADRTASLLLGFLPITRTRLSPVGDDELPIGHDRWTTTSMISGRTRRSIKPQSLREGSSAEPGFAISGVYSDDLNRYITIITFRLVLP